MFLKLSIPQKWNVPTFDEDAFLNASAEYFQCFILFASMNNSE